MTVALVNTAERLLLVDADSDLLTTLGELLLGIGYVLAGAANGGQAVALLDSFQPTAIVLDLRVPGLEPLELAAQARARVPAPRLIALTADGSIAARRRAVAAGIRHFLVKPVRVQTLRRVLESSRRSAAAELGDAAAPVSMRRRRQARAEQYCSTSYRDLLTTLATNLRRLRHAQGWTQEEAARQCAMTPRLLQRLEAGTLNATMTTLARLCEGFAVDAETLLRAQACPAPLSPAGPRSGSHGPS